LFFKYILSFFLFFLGFIFCLKSVFKYLVFLKFAMFKPPKYLQMHFL
jgi:hypothetical protein